jgi:N-acetylglutamate synthase-like GNAT family acetyltransferase
MIKNLTKQKQQEIVDFIKDNYEAPEFLIPKSVEDLVEKHGLSEVFIIEDEHGIEALSFFKLLTPKLAEKYRTVVRLDVRGHGLSKKIDEHVENLLRNSGIKKIKTNIYVDNYPSLFGRLKKGYLIEGLLRNHDEPGRHEYILGKELR